METVSWIAVAIIGISLAIALMRKLPAAGALLMANFAVFALSAFGPQAGRLSVIQTELALQTDLLATGEPIAALQLITSMFVHADFYHLIGNLIVLFAFAFPFEERVGAKKFLAAYFLAGLVGTFTFVAINWGESSLLMGASGAVFGIIGAFAGAYPRLVLPLPLPLFIIMIFVRMRVIVAAAVFALMQILSLQFLSSYSNTAYWAHLGGLVAGLALAPMFRKKKQIENPAMAANLSTVRIFAKSPRAKAALAHMESNKDEPEIYGIWVQELVKYSEPVDGRQLVLVKGKAQVVELRS